MKTRTMIKRMKLVGNK